MGPAWLLLVLGLLLQRRARVPASSNRIHRAIMGMIFLAAVGLASTAAAKAPTAQSRVAVVRRPDIPAYQVLTKAFREQLNAAVEVFELRELGHMALVSKLRAYQPKLVLLIGQSAYDLVRKEDRVGTVLHVLVSHNLNPAHHPVQSMVPPISAVVSGFQAARPKIRKLAVLHGPGQGEAIREARRAAARLGIELKGLQASSSGRALTLLRRLPPSVEGLWLIPDTRVLSPRVFHYALHLQQQRRTPLMGATRHHAKQGALFALDHDPQALGHCAAAMAKHLLEQPRAIKPSPLQPTLTINLNTARRLVVDTEALLRMAGEVVR